jgi:hypothetical protein
VNPPRLRADDVVGTPAERASLTALRDLTGEVDGPMERHCLRDFLIARRLDERSGGAADREVLLCAALLHDAGAYLAGGRTGPYVTDGRHVAARTLAPFGWEAERLRRCLDAVELHHRLTPQTARGQEVELLRRADLIDLVSAGSRNRWLSGLAAAVPRNGVYREVGAIVWREARAGRLAPIFWVRPEEFSGSLE